MLNRRLTRRRILKQGIIAAPVAFASAKAGETVAQPGLSTEDDAFLDELERASFLFFWEQADPHTGLVKDRCNTTLAQDKGVAGSVAATGFGLTALCIGHKRGYGPSGPITLRVLSCLEFLWKKMPTHRGFFFHWANVNTGERIWDSEVSTVDTAILLCGILTCREYFHHQGIINLANAILNRVDWTWVAEDTALLAHGWMPEGGFLPYRWDIYSELMMMYLLGLGSPTHPLPDGAWKRLETHDI
jgi:hypothetical protein